jgi:hypothetical protein
MEEPAAVLSALLSKRMQVAVATATDQQQQLEQALSECLQALPLGLRLVGTSWHSKLA